jgi:hypothetical protein
MTPAKMLIMMGRWWRNELVYNPTTWAEWTKSGTVVADATGIQLTSVNNVAASITLPTNLKSNTKYGVLYNCITLQWTATWVMSSTSAFPSIVLPTSTGMVKTTATTDNPITSNNVQLFLRSALGQTDTAKLTDIRLFELPTGSQIETDFTNLTADQLNALYPF